MAEDVLIDKLLGTFRSLKGDKNTEGKSKRGGVIAGVVAGAVALLIIAVLSFRARRMGKKLAKLLHEKDVNEEKAFQAKIDIKLIENEKAIKVASEKIKKIDLKINKIDKEIQETTEIFVQTKVTIQEIKTWDDLDNR